MTNEIIEVARYLKVPRDIPEQTKATIIEMLAISNKLTPQKKVAFFDIENNDKGIKLLGTNIILEGVLAKKHFVSCKKLIVVLATLGMQSELLLKEYFAKNAEKAVVLDACFTVGIENYLDRVEKEFCADGLSITTRISCGYGDLKLEYQKDLLDLLDGKKIGVFQNDSYMLTPNKSVIALIGVKNEIN